LAFCLTEQKPYPEKELTPDRRGNTDHRAFPTFVQDLKDFFWEDLQGEVQRAAQGLFQLLSERQRDLYIVSPRYA